MTADVTIGRNGPPPRRLLQLYNRTGATIYKGQAAMLDVALTQAESLSFQPGASGQCYDNVGPCVQIGVDGGVPIYLCHDDSIADNALGWFLAEGLMRAIVLDDDVSTTDVDKLDAIGILVSESATALQGAASAGRRLGTAFEDAAAATDASATQYDASSHYRWVVWTGGRWAD